MFALSFSSGVSYLKTYKHRTPSEEETSVTELDWQMKTANGSFG